MAGYHEAPGLTAETITADGWIRTRDLGQIDDRGYLTLVDRSSDMIITGGYNVYPREVEEALLAHPAVTGAAVVGAPDDAWVEAVTAFVTLCPGVSTSEDELRQAVRARLAGHKVPKTVQVIDAIPVSPVGKVLRRALREPLDLVNRRSVLSLPEYSAGYMASAAAADGVRVLGVPAGADPDTPETPGRRLLQAVSGAAGPWSGPRGQRSAFQEFLVRGSPGTV